jgi:CheY-like chemotaxis protein
MPNLDGFETIRELSSDPATRQIPVIVSTSSVIDNEMRARLSKAAAIVSKQSLSRETLGALLQELARGSQVRAT